MTRNWSIFRGLPVPSITQRADALSSILRKQVLPHIHGHLLGPQREQTLGLARIAGLVHHDSQLGGHGQRQGSMGTVVDADQAVLEVIEPVVGLHPPRPALAVKTLVSAIVIGPPFRHRCQVEQLALMAVMHFLAHRLDPQAEIDVLVNR